MRGSRVWAGDFSGAVDAIQKSRSLSVTRGRFYGGDNSWNSFILAMTYWQLGNPEAARREFAFAAQWMDRREPREWELRALRTEAAVLGGDHWGRVES